MSSSKTSAKVSAPERVILAILVCFSLFTFVGPTVRAFYHLEVNYNEGWNAYNAEAAAHHYPLYATKYSWTTVNYPLVSFYLIGYLSRFLGDPVLIGRLISLAALSISCVLVALIVKRLIGCWAPAIFGGAFCLALFCSATPDYVGMNDPQLLAHLFFLAALWLYLANADGSLSIAPVAALCVLGGSIKQSLLPVPAAVLIDAWGISRRKAMRFLVFGAVFLGVSIGANILVGGPFFITKLLMPRGYSLGRALQFSRFYLRLLIPLAVSVGWSLWHLRDRKFRIVSIYFILSLSLGLALTGGTGSASMRILTIFWRCRL